MKCKCCKEKEAVNFNGDYGICDACLIDIQLAFRYHITGKEIIQEEYQRSIKNDK